MLFSFKNCTSWHRESYNSLKGQLDEIIQFNVLAIDHSPIYARDMYNNNAKFWVFGSGPFCVGWGRGWCVEGMLVRLIRLLHVRLRLG